MTRWAVGDIQGCYEPLRALLERIRFSVDRDCLWLVGDLVNRGPKSLEVLRFVQSLGENAVVVLGNHDLHLLALVYGTKARPRSGDTMRAILDAPDRDELLEWLLTRPLAHFEPLVEAGSAGRNTPSSEEQPGQQREGKDQRHGASEQPRHSTQPPSGPGQHDGDLLIHGALIPQWSASDALQLAGEVQAELQGNPRALFDHMYGDKPDRWDPELEGFDRLRFIINTLTRMRFCSADGQIDIRIKGPPSEAQPPFKPWFEHELRESRDTRVIFGHWSALGYLNTGNVVALDSGCVWGNALTALNLDNDGPPVHIPCPAR